MTVPFAQTLRSLRTDADRRPRSRLVIPGVVLVGWFAWAALGELTLYEVSRHARLESMVSVHPIASTHEGRVVASHLRIGRRVERGDVLVELDATLQEHDLARSAGLRADCQRRIEALELECAAATRLGASQGVADRSAVAQARKRLEVARTRIETRTRELRSRQELFAQSLVSELELLAARDQLGVERAEAQALELSVRQLEEQQLARRAEHDLELARLNRQLVALRGQLAAEAARAAQLGAERAQRVIRAPIAGVIGDVGDLQPGAVVRAGAVLGRIIPPGGVRAVARFDARAAGRLQRGQQATIRLEGFPWTRFGALPAIVSLVAREPDDHRALRVEFELHPDPHSAIPIQHGLPGAVEVEVERSSPLAFLLRSAGDLIQPESTTVTAAASGR